MARNFVGIVSNVSPVISVVNPSVGISSLGVNWGILHNNISDSSFNTDNTVPYIVGTATSASGALLSSVVVNTPANNTGDLLLAFITSKVSGRTFSSSGWTVERQNSTNTPSQAILSKISTGSENSTQTFTVTGGTSEVACALISVRSWNNLYVGEFGAQANPPTVPLAGVPSELYRNLMLFFIGNDGNGRSWDINNISEYTISLLNAQPPSLDLAAIYNEPIDVALDSYATSQSGAGANSYGINVIIDNYSKTSAYHYIVSTSNSATANTITLGQVNAGDLIVLFFEDNSLITVPTGFTKIVSSETSNPYLAVATKTAVGTETTLTGVWEAAASMVIRGATSVVGTAQGPTSSTVSTAPSITLTQPSLVVFWTVNNNTSRVVTPPTGWSQIQRANGNTREGYLYANNFLNAGPTGTVTATWDATPVNSVLVAFTLS